MDKKKMQNKRIRKDDKVIVISGNWKGMTGKILSRTEDSAIVQGVNVKKRHVKKSQEHPQGGIVEFEHPIKISNLMICDDQEKPVKLKVKLEKNGDKELYYLKGKKQVKYRSL